MQLKKVIQFFSIIIASVLLITTAVYIYIPEGAIKINDDITIKVPTINSIFASRKVEYADISHIKEKSIASKNLLPHLIETISTDSLKTLTDSLSQNVFQIQYPKGKEKMLFSFFSNLKNNDSTLIRIFHYGDSQIEGDRISSQIRDKMQKNFGGAGVGYIPAYEKHAPSTSIYHYNSENWIHEKVFKNRKYNTKHGIFTSYNKYTSSYAWISYIKRKERFANNNKYKNCKIFYGDNSADLKVNIYDGDSLLTEDTLFAMKNSFAIKQFDIKKTPKKLTIKFLGNSDVKIYGIALDKQKGVAVDNIPMRGSSGTDFIRLDSSLLKKMYLKVSPKLLILQFGVNVVPKIKKKYDFYYKSFSAQLKYLKQIMPKIPIIVIGVSDMSKKQNDNMVSYPNITKIRDAQKKAAFENNCAFWDAFKAMGGTNSMPMWVSEKPPLAKKDYTHLTNKGADIMANMIFNAIISEYLNFLIVKNVNK